MAIGLTTRIGDIAAEFPATTRIFERHGIDYCCGGRKTLEEACTLAGVDAGSLLASIRADVERAEPTQIAPAFESLGAIIARVVNVHHVFTRSEIERAERLFAKVCSVHGGRHPELFEARGAFEALRDELIPHMMKEELILFPYVRSIERAAELQQRPAQPPFGSVLNPVRMMNIEHESAGAVLRSLRALTHEFTPPADACGSFRALYDSLASLERDLHEHMHLESNVIFPRGIEIEARLRSETCVA